MRSGRSIFELDASVDDKAVLGRPRKCAELLQHSIEGGGSGLIHDTSGKLRRLQRGDQLAGAVPIDPVALLTRDPADQCLTIGI